MTCSPARLAANQRNAARSTGPKTEDGKAKSRANAMKHGLTAEVVRSDDEREAAGPLAGWLEGEAVVLAMRIDRAQQAEERERERAALRAVSCWDEDRRREADRVARGLARRPDRVVRALRATAHGCAWLIERWGWLRDAAQRDGGWSAEHQALASDLRGIPEAFRGRSVEPAGQHALAEAEIVALGTLRESLKGSDAFERETTRRGLDDAATPELRRVIRYEAALQRRLRWCLELRAIASPPVPTPAAAKAPTAPPQPPAPSRPVLDPVGARPGFPIGDRPVSPAPGHVLPIAMVPVGPRPRFG